MSNSEKSFTRLLRLMARLRSKNGCPWDRAQTHASIKKHLIEEAYEVCDAIDSGDPERLKDELGDFLFQVIFHAQLAKERGAFDINGVLETSYKKMVRRHPHVFGRRKASGPDEAYRRWQEKKDLEAPHKGKKGLLKGIPDSLPALLKAEKVIKRAEWRGLEWKNKKSRGTKDIGDMLFNIVDLARQKGVVAEEALDKAVKKFAGRFSQG
ncbi:MAG: MazG family protein [Candidatus Omnitrophica bacterium]|nr:MazG family protein [Candidatus Omnitrophota bacterium]